VCLGNSAGSVADACNNLAAPVCYTFTITGPNITVTPTNPNCSTGTGTIVAAASAGTGPYNYSINGGAYQASGTFTSLAAGTYTLTTIDNGTGCQNNTTSTITIPTAISVTATPTNATCANNDGSIATSVTGGTAGYTYAWSPSGTGANPSGLSPATYTVTVTDSKGCTKTATAVITQTGTVTANFTTPASQCLTGNSFSFTNTGTAGVTYNWNYGDAGTGSSSSVSHTYASSGTFTVTETVTSGVCSATHTAAITVKPMPTVTVNSPTVCAGNSVSLTAAGASTYTWNTGSTANPLSVTPGATSYTVTGTSAVGCTNTAVSTVTVAASPTVTVSSATMCPGASMTLTASGASTYTWAPSATLSSSTGSSVTASPTVTTVYTITGTSAASCTATTTATVTIGGAITPSVPSATICAGSSTTLNATGGTTYTWSPATGLSGTSGASVTANPASTTTYTINAANGACTGSTTAVVTVNPLPTVTVNSPSICINGSTTLNASGAATYSWSPSTGLSATTGASVTANPTVTTTYTVVGTTATCTAQATSIVTVNPLPTITVNAPSICPGATGTLTASGASTYTWNTGANGATITDSPSSTTNYTVTGTSAAGCVSTATTSITVLSGLTITPPSATICVGASTTLTASGAATYTWSPGTGLSSTTGASVTANPTVSTTYTITGSSGTCSATATATLIVNPLPTVSVNSGTICIGQQTATLTASGASTYTWNPATGLSSANGSSVVANPTSTTSYTVSGTDGNGCVNTATTTVVANPTPTLTLNSGFICNGSSTTLNASGASTYAWSPGTGLSATTGASVTANPTVTTQYTITGTDVNGCTGTDTTSVIVVANPIVTVASATICINNSATLTAAGASTYVWANGTGLSSTSGTSVNASPATTTVYTITGTAGTCTAVTTATVTVNSLPNVTVNSQTICLGQQTATLSAAGALTYSWDPSSGLSSTTGTSVTGTPSVTTSYTVIGTDVNGCVNTATTSITVNPIPTVTVSPGLICVGSSTTLTAGGAVTYSWMPGTGLSSTTGSSVNANPATTTQYTVVGIDANGCVNGDTATLTVVANPVISVASSTICIGNSTNLTANGATTYTWSPATGLNTTSGANVTANPTVTSVYTIDGTAGTCTATTTATVVVNPLPVITIGSNSPVCVNQTLNLTSSGGPGYFWNGPNNFTSTLQNPNITGVTTAAAGTYTLTIVDINTCVNSATVNVVVNPLPVVTVGGSTVCLNQTISLSASGGTGYSWSGPLGFGSNQQNPTIPNATPGMAGTYVVTVTDTNNCVNANVAQVVLNSIPVVSATSGTVCIGSTIQLIASGANTYAWFPATGLSSASSATVNAGPNATTTYTVIGTDANGCVDTTTTFVNVNPKPVIALTPSASSGCAPVCVSFSNTAGTTGTCTWTFGDGSTSTNCAINHCFNVAGTYTSIYTLTDVNGCKNTDTSITTVYPVPDADFSFDPQPTTILDPYIHFHNQTTGGAMISTLSWTFGDNSGMTSASSAPTHTYLEAGSYPVELVVVSNHGCRDSIKKTVVIGEDYFIYVPNAFSPNMDGVNDSFFAKGEGIKDFKLYIFDRWGNQVFFSDDIYKGWDGRFMGKGEAIVQEDVYVWKIELKTFKNEPKMLKGTVTLIK
ncbi:MAG: PKD domain-containing protein, partial [Bacteroidia bacterium]